MPEVQPVQKHILLLSAYKKLEKTKSAQGILEFSRWMQESAPLNMGYVETRTVDMGDFLYAKQRFEKLAFSYRKKLLRMMPLAEPAAGRKNGIDPVIAASAKRNFGALSDRDEGLLAYQHLISSMFSIPELHAIENQARFLALSRIFIRIIADRTPNSEASASLFEKAGMSAAEGAMLFQKMAQQLEKSMVSTDIPFEFFLIRKHITSNGLISTNGQAPHLISHQDSGVAVSLLKLFTNELYVQGKEIETHHQNINNQYARYAQMTQEFKVFMNAYYALCIVYQEHLRADNLLDAAGNPSREYFRSLEKR